MQCMTKSKIGLIFEIFLNSYKWLVVAVVPFYIYRDESNHHTWVLMNARQHQLEYGALVDDFHAYRSMFRLLPYDCTDITNSIHLSHRHMPQVI
jgi:hypothetical protein